MPEETYTTKDEICFIDSLGDKQSPHERMRKLISYGNTIKSRQNWGRIDKSEVIKHVTKLLAQVRKPK
ncbi:MAG: hypothetical protein WAX44_01065 [Minisyncoccia bacterium]